MKTLKIIGLVILGLLGLMSLGQLLLSILGIVLMATGRSSGNMSYVIGQATGSLIMLALIIAGFRAILKKLNDSSSPRP